MAKYNKQRQQTVFYDGTKALNAWNVDDMQGWTVSGGISTRTEDEYFRTVPWLYRGVKDRANNVGRMPFAILQGEKEIDTSTGYKNVIKCMPNPTTLFKRIEMSICMTGKAYIRLERNKNGYVGNLKYLAPSTIAEKYNGIGEIETFERTVNNQKFPIPATDIIAIYDPDYTTENGPGTSSSAKAALASAGVLFNIDDFVSKFFERGAIKATILTTQGFSEQEAQKTQHWWDDVVSGVKNAWSGMVLKGEKVNATVIGEGLESLQNDSLTTERRQNIATALGVPESRLWSAAANYATSQQDDKNYINGTIAPDNDLIAEAFNTQLFTKENKLEGYTLDFQYETLDVFQEDAAEQASGVQTLTNAGVPLLMAMDLMGMDLTDDQRAELEALKKKDEEEPEPPPIVEPVIPIPTEPEAEQEKVDNTPVNEDMKRWQRKALKRLKDGKNASCDFDSHYISPVTNGAIMGALEACETVDHVRKVFNQYIEWVEYP